MRLAIALVLALAGTASAEDQLPTIDSVHAPAITIAPRTARATLDVRSAPRVSWLTITPASTRRASATDIAIDVPAGTRVVGLGLVVGGGEVWGEPAGDRAAEAADAAVDWRRSSSGSDHLHLRVMSGATVELALELPALDTLVVDSIAAVTVDGDRRAGNRIDLRGVAAIAEHDVARVADGVALVANVDARPSVVVDFPAPRVHVSRDLDKTIIRREVRRHLNALSYCVTREAQRDRRIVTVTARLAFLIRPDGTTDGRTADGVPDSIATCMTDEIATWRFPQTDGNTQVHYPVTVNLKETR